MWQNNDYKKLTALQYQNGSKYLNIIQALIAIV
jgi:hypothetical protein